MHTFIYVNTHAHYTTVRSQGCARQHYLHLHNVPFRLSRHVAVSTHVCTSDPIAASAQAAHALTLRTTPFARNPGNNSALWVAPVDFLVMIFTFLVTLLWNVELGLEYGIIASVVILLLQISKLDMDSIGQLKITDDEGGLPTLTKEGMQFRPMDNYPSARQHPEIKVRGVRMGHGRVHGACAWGVRMGHGVGFWNLDLCGWRGWMELHGRVAPPKQTHSIPQPSPT